MCNGNILQKAGFYVILVLSTFSVQAQQAPQASISNGLLQAKLYLPDQNSGYYRGTRFDWSGVIPELIYKGHNYFGQWFEQYSPTLHDAIMGPVEDFAPLSFETAKPGETFVKIGIGVITRPDTARYIFARAYPIVNAGKWRVAKKRDQITFVHQLQDTSYAYEYTKQVQLVKGKPELVIFHKFKNTGRQAIETNVYNHNFFVFDSSNVGPGIDVKFPFTLQTDTTRQSSNGEIQGNRIVITKDFTKADHVFYRMIEGFGPTAADYNIQIENNKTGTGLKITCDRPLSKLVFWSAIKTVCPEPYILLKAAPGETFTWTIRYQFYTLDAKTLSLR